MPRVSEALRQQVTVRAQGLCEYCQTAQIIVVTMEVDHIIPEAASGETKLENLCLTCRGCNSFKQDYQTGIDPNSGIEINLYNPRTQNWNEHFLWSEDSLFIIGQTPVGRATVDRLRMNREGVIAARRLWVQAGWHPPQQGKFPLT